MKLSERKKKILQSVIENYVDTAVPVSSAEIQKHCMQDISSATIRSELAALEEMGYLIQPYTSAGRMPSSQAYKYYIDNCLNLSGLEIIDQLENAFHEKLSDIETLMRETAKIISDVTNYTSIVVLDGYNNLTIENIKIVDLGNGSALVIIVTDGGVLKDKTIVLPDGIKDNFLNSVIYSLNNIFAGVKINELETIDYEQEIDFSIAGFNEIFNKIYDILSQYRTQKESKLYLEGTDKIFKHKEYENIDNVKNFMQIISEKERLKEIMSTDNNAGIQVDIKIGKDDSKDLENMALVTATYKINGIDIGHAGVIGPERMDYKKVVNVLEQVNKTLSELINNKE